MKTIKDRITGREIKVHENIAGDVWIIFKTLGILFKKLKL